MGIDRRRVGFTIVELLVALGVIGLLIALLLPAVQSAREAARRARCQTNLRQIGIAVQAYHDRLGAFPPGRIPSFDVRYAGPAPPCTSLLIDRSVFIAILPDLEQGALHAAINHSLTIFGYENRSLVIQSIGVLACPSDPDAGAPRRAILGPDTPSELMPTDPLRLSFTSYVFNHGSIDTGGLPALFAGCRVPSQVQAEANGVFNDLVSVRVSEITDGTSQTMMAAERATSLLAGLETGAPDIHARYGWYVAGNKGDTLFTSFYPINMPLRVGGFAGYAHARAASSNHPGGVNVLMADGSARFVRESIDTWAFDRYSGQPVGAVRTAGGWWSALPSGGVWQGLATRAGGELISASDY
jgi:prepilin-type processing-associated H-X9-DG protein